MLDNTDRELIRKLLYRGELKELAGIVGVHRSTASKVLAGKAKHKEMEKALMDRAKENLARKESGMQSLKTMV